MEQVLIWPAQYPLLLRGLAEQNGAFILDALESWPHCGHNIDDEGVKTHILPPLLYLLWLKPHDPFEVCFFQHIHDFSEKDKRYLEELVEHLVQSKSSCEIFVISLIEKLIKYCDLSSQVDALQFPRFYQLLLSKQYFNIINWSLQKNVLIANEDLCKLWLHKELQAGIKAHFESCISNKQLAIETIKSDILLGNECYELLALFCDQKTSDEVLEEILFIKINQVNIKQSELMPLIAQGAKGITKDKQGKSAFMFAIEKGFVNIVEQLLPVHRATDIDNQGQTFLHYAMTSNSKSMVDTLIDYGVNPRQRDKLGATPYKKAVTSNAMLCKKALEQHGVKELSEKAQLQRINTVHSLYALVAVLFPLQIVLFFDTASNIKISTVTAITISSLVLFLLAWLLKSTKLYPVRRHPWSLQFLKAFGFISMGLQSMFTALVMFTFITL